MNLTMKVLNLKSYFLVLAVLLPIIIVSGTTSLANRSYVNERNVENLVSPVVGLTDSSSVGSDGRVTTVFKWQSVPTATSYSFSLQNLESGSIDSVANLNDTTYMRTNLVPNTNYAWYVDVIEDTLITRSVIKNFKTPEFGKVAPWLATRGFEFGKKSVPPGPGLVLGTITEGDQHQVFGSPPCIEGEYYIAYQMEYDLSNFTTGQPWESGVVLSLWSDTTRLWSNKLHTQNLGTQAFLSTIFHDSTLTCNTMYTYTIDSIWNSGTVPVDDIVIKQKLYGADTLLFNPGVAGTLGIEKKGPNKFKASWTFPQDMIREYDLEWVFIDSLENFTGSTAQEAFAFKEGVRITKTKTYHEFQEYYPGGTLWFRVRAVGASVQYPDHRIPGTWQYGAGTSLTISNHQSDMNWQTQTSFAEEGKSKTVVAYADGSGRVRQQVTGLATDLHAIVAETLYDYEGRPVVQTLPVPVSDELLGYRSDFNVFVSSDALITSVDSTGLRKKFYYDNANLENGTLASTSGAGKYYSPNNDVGGAHTKYVPRSDGYAYSQVSYVNDNTGRVRRQSGVGSKFRIDSLHATRNYYGEPSSAELIRLFGSNVGDASRYKKNLVVDPNGQVSVSYVDQADRVIATALAGAKPENLDALPSLTAQPGDTVFVDITPKNKIENTESVLEYTILNAVPQTEYNFDYDFSALASQVDSIGCVECTYTLTMEVTGPDGLVFDLSSVPGNEAAQGLAYEREISAASCENPTLISDIQFSLVFPEIGEYHVSKTLTAHEFSFEQVRTLILQDSAVITEIQVIESQYVIDSAGCDNCTACATADSVAIMNNTLTKVTVNDCANILENIRQRLISASIEPTDSAIMADSEYCSYELCVKNKRSDVFDRELAFISDWSEAVSQSYDQTLALDPFFDSGDTLSGSTYTSTMQNKLDNISLGTIDVDTNGDGTPESSTPLTGTIEEICDPANSDFFVDEYGLKNVNGKHLLYYDLQDQLAQALITQVEYDSIVNINRWQMFRGFYMEAKRMTKLEIPEITACPAVLAMLQAQSDTGIQDTANTNGLSDPVSDVQLLTTFNGIHFNCDADITEEDSLSIIRQLRGYFNSSSDNYYFLIRKNDLLSGDLYLDSIKTTLSNYSCGGLDSIAEDNPLECQQEIIIKVPKSGGGVGALLDGSSAAGYAFNTVIPVEHERKRAIPVGQYYQYSGNKSYVPSIDLMEEDIFKKEEQRRRDSLEWVLAMRPPKQKPSKIAPNHSMQHMQGRKGGSVDGEPVASDWVTVPQSELDVLICLRDKILVQYNAPVLSNWTDTTLVDQWNGVTVLNGHVVEINILNPSGYSWSYYSDIDITTCSFSDLTELTNLKLPTQLVINLSQIASLYNLQSTTIGGARGDLSNIASLTSLEYLSLASVTTNYAVSGSINSLQNLNNLKDLYIYEYYINGDISAFNNLNALENIELYANSLVGDISVFSNKYNLTTLRLRYAQGLSGSIASFINCSQLSYLDLSNSSSVSGSILNLSNLKNLRHIILDRTSVDGDFGIWVTDSLQNLNTLYLNQTNVSGDITTGNFLNLVSLRDLKLSDTSISGNLGSLRFSSSSLEYLYLNNTNLIGAIDSLDLSANPNLKVLNFQYNELEGDLSGLDLSNQNSMYDLYFSYTGINSDVSNWDIKNTNLLRDLVLTNNGLSGYLDLTGLPIQRNGVRVDYNRFNFDELLFLKSTLEPTVSDFYYNGQDLVDTTRSIVAISGQPIVLKANVDTNTTPLTTYQWYKEGIGTPLQTYSTDSTYSFIVNEADSGVYYYTSTNSALPNLTLRSRDINLSVFVPQYDSITVCLKYNPDNPVIQKFGFKIDWQVEKTKCIARQDSIVTVQREIATEKYIERKVAEYYSSVQTNCISTISESMSYTYVPNEYHYTLYYYDQAGNLVQTVPPKGVMPLSASEVAQHLNNTASPEPAHNLLTRYKYNSLNQVVEQTTPDAGVSQFWYDAKGQLRLSQNAKQASDTAYSYTRYDALGRIVEVGEYVDATSIVQLQDSLDSRKFPSDTALYTFRDVTATTYDRVDSTAIALGFTQENLRNRVSGVTVTDNLGAEPVATYYSYDIHGNVKELLQVQPGLEPKHTEYRYDLVSGNVNYVIYQEGQSDQFYHAYSYDDDNRIKFVETSTDGFVWSKEAEYEYYAHGPLARVLLGNHSSQGLDYYYTLQGWIKGVNMPVSDDPGADGTGASLVGKDQFAYTLGYYKGDYAPVDSLLALPGARDNLWTRYTESTTTNGLYNGNISWMLTDLPGLGVDKEAQAMLYHYDQLNRIAAANSLTNYSQGSGFAARTGTPEAYDASYSYDANGNLLTLQRYNDTLALADDFMYTYYPGTNRLAQVEGLEALKVYEGYVPNQTPPYQDIVIQNTTVSAGTTSNVQATSTITILPETTLQAGTGTDINLIITDSSNYNYIYDEIGNLVADLSEDVTISWTPYGKVRQVNKADTLQVNYRYDGAGNRIAKIVTLPDSVTTTSYVRDASGNVLAVYTDAQLKEQPIYGSNRLGEYLTGTEAGTRTLGNRHYELSNHLGNVLAVVSDNIYMENDTTTTRLVSTSDYYPFGLDMPGRSYTDTLGNRSLGEGYRYGFNGKERDLTTSLGSTHYDYGFRIYNPRVAKFLSVDPLTKSYPMLTPYQFASNTPIQAIDLDGLEKKAMNKLENDYKKAQGYKIVIDKETMSTMIRKIELSNLQREGSYVDMDDRLIATYTETEVTFNSNGEIIKVNKNSFSKTGETFFPGYIGRDTWFITSTKESPLTPGYRSNFDNKNRENAFKAMFDDKVVSAVSYLLSKRIYLSEEDFKFNSLAFKDKFQLAAESILKTLISIQKKDVEDPFNLLDKLTDAPDKNKVELYLPLDKSEEESETIKEVADKQEVIEAN